jgi:hypothetical protein
MNKPLGDLHIVHFRMKDICKHDVIFVEKSAPKYASAQGPTVYTRSRNGRGSRPRQARSALFGGKLCERSSSKKELMGRWITLCSEVRPVLQRRRICHPTSRRRSRTLFPLNTMTFQRYGTARPAARANRCPPLSCRHARRRRSDPARTRLKTNAYVWLTNRSSIIKAADRKRAASNPRSKA